MLNLIADECFRLSKETADLRAAINAEIEKLNRDSESIAADARAIDGVTADQITRKHLDQLRELQLARVELLRRELSIRKLLDAKWFPAITSARSKEIKVAAERYEAVKADVRQRLISIGYSEGADPNTGRPYIQPGMIFEHPECVAAFQHHDQVDRIFHACAGREPNTAEIAKVERNLNEIVTKLKRAA